MHVARMLAKLQPGSVRYDSVPGGSPGITSEDVAGALVYVTSKLGRELLCALWWPGGAHLSQDDVRLLIVRAQLAEAQRRAEAMAQAQTAVLEAHLAGARPNRRALQQAHGREWPAPCPTYALVTDAVLAELSGDLCSDCGGRGQVQSDTLITTCKTCNGRGAMSWSNRRRALAVRMSESGYRRSRWTGVHDWTMSLCQDELRAARQALADALG